MTPNRQMATIHTAQQDVIAALHAISEHNLAGRLESCVAIRRERHHGYGWPRICRSAACVWCRSSGAVFTSTEMKPRGQPIVTFVFTEFAMKQTLWASWCMWSSFA
jgi:hypothetical protein